MAYIKFSCPGVVAFCHVLPARHQSSFNVSKEVRNKASLSANWATKQSKCQSEPPRPRVSFLPVANSWLVPPLRCPFPSPLMSWAGPGLPGPDILLKTPTLQQSGSDGLTIILRCFPPANYGFRKIRLGLLVVYYLTDEPNLQSTIKINQICVSLLAKRIGFWNICRVSGHLFEEFHN